MTLLAMSPVEGGAAICAGFVLGVVGCTWLERRARRRRQLAAEQGVEDAKRQAEAIEREARLAATEEAAKLREQTEKSFASRRREMAEAEARLAQRESLVNQQLQNLLTLEQHLNSRDAELAVRIAAAECSREELAREALRSRAALEKVARCSTDEARQHLLRQVEKETLRDCAELSRRLIDHAKSAAEEKARRILSIAIQRYASEYTFETTTATLAIQGDEIKGRIIGREGRNIRAFEAATGVTVLIDDTPGAVVLSGFDPVRREVARETMSRLIQDGRIHPTRIEEVVAKVNQEMDETILRAGDEAVARLGLTPLHPEIVNALGRLRFRQSFSQNILEHSIEVAFLTGMLAAELGLEAAVGRRTGLLHDIGKALDHELEGSHALIGADFIRRLGEPDDVVNGVASHHDEVPHIGVWGILVSAADAISASRPGARSETVTTYLKRMEGLERIGETFEGVEKCFAVQAGRELRVIVRPEEVPDEKAFALARGIARRIEEQLQFPGQIRVTVIRETRCVEFAK